MKIIQLALLLSLFNPIVSAQAAKSLGNPDAPQGGTYLLSMNAEPTTLNPITAIDAYSGQIHGYILEGLMSRNVDTYEWEPSLATSVTASKDGTQFTIKLRKGVKFSDGKPVTVEDVKFSFDVIFDDTYNSLALRSYYSGLKDAKIIDPETVVFTAKEKYFKIMTQWQA